VGNGHGLQITHTGTGTLFTPHASFNLNKVLCVPTIQKNLLSVQKFAIDNFVFFEFWPHYFLVKDQITKQVLMQGPSEDIVYWFRTTSPTAHAASISPTFND
jgi:hypothetical protein